MIACVDVGYFAADARNPDRQTARSAVLSISSWDADIAVERCVVEVPDVADYVPGQFYRRELPCIVAALDALAQPYDCVVVDGYVWLGNQSEPGLGAHLFERLNRRVAVIGVAKNPFRRSTFALPITRGSSDRPLYVTAAGIDVGTAGRHVATMHGRHRMPTMLKQVDRMSRGETMG